MADVTIGGTEYHIDISQMTYGDFIELRDPKQSQDDEDRIIAKCAGMTLEQLRAVPYPDARRLIKAIIQEAVSPLDDPN